MEYGSRKIETRNNEWKRRPLHSLAETADSAQKQDLEAPLSERYIRLRLTNLIEKRFNQLWYQLYKGLSESLQQRAGVPESGDVKLADYAKRALQLLSLKHDVNKGLAAELEEREQREQALKMLDSELHKLDQASDQVLFLDRLSIKGPRGGSEVVSAVGHGSKYRDWVLRQLGIPIPEEESAVFVPQRRVFSLKPPKPTQPQQVKQLAPTPHKRRGSQPQTVNTPKQQEEKQAIQSQNAFRPALSLSEKKQHGAKTLLTENHNERKGRNRRSKKVILPKQATTSTPDKGIRQSNQRVGTGILASRFFPRQGKVVPPLPQSPPASQATRKAFLTEVKKEPQLPTGSIAPLFGDNLDNLAAGTEGTLEWGARPKRLVHKRLSDTQLAYMALATEAQSTRGLSQKSAQGRREKQDVHRIAATIYGSTRDRRQNAELRRTMTLAKNILRHDGAARSVSAATSPRAGSEGFSSCSRRVLGLPRPSEGGTFAVALGELRQTSVGVWRPVGVKFASFSRGQRRRCRSVEERRSSQAQFDALLIDCAMQQRSAEAAVVQGKKLRRNTTVSLQDLAQRVTEPPEANTAAQFMAFNKHLFIYGKKGLGHYLNANAKDMIKTSDMLMHLNPKYPFMTSRLNDIVIKEP